VTCPKQCETSSPVAGSLLAIERYRKGEASLGRAAETAVSVGQMMTILGEFGIESRIEKDDYPKGLRNLAKIW
jgi:predicted HTH domain antitoxin